MSDNELFVKIGGDASGLGNALATASKALSAFGIQIPKTGNLLKVGLTAAFAATAVAVGVSSVKIYKDFEEAMSRSLAIMGPISDEMRSKMETAAREVGKSTLYSASEAAEAYFFLASAGMDAATQIEALPRVAAFAQAGMFDLALATDLLTDAQSALGMTTGDTAVDIENMTRISDVLVKANTLANASVQQFSEALTSKAGAALRSLNKDVEEGVAVLAALADQGLKGSEAGEALSRTMIELKEKAVTNAGAFQKYGIAVFDSNGNMRHMADIIGDVERAYAGLSPEQQTVIDQELGLQKRSADTMRQLVGTSEKIREYEEGLRNAGGTTDEVANNQLQNFAAKWELLMSKVKDIAITIGGPLVSALTRVVDVLSPAVTWVAKMIDAFVKGEGVMKALKPIIIGLVGAFAGFKIGGMVSGWVHGIAGAFSGLTQHAATATIQTANAGAAVGGLAGPIGMAVGGAVALGGAIYSLWQKQEAEVEAFRQGVIAASEHTGALESLRGKVEDLTVGTQEYTDALEAQRAKAQEVVDTAGKEFAIYDDSGRVVDAYTGLIDTLANSYTEVNDRTKDLISSEASESEQMRTASKVHEDNIKDMDKIKEKLDERMETMERNIKLGKGFTEAEVQELKELEAAYEESAVSVRASFEEMEEGVIEFGERISGPEGLSAMTWQDVSALMDMLNSSSPQVNELALNMFHQIVAAEVSKHPEIAGEMQGIMGSVMTQIMELPAGERTLEKMQEILQSEIDKNPEITEEMKTIMTGILGQITGTDLYNSSLTTFDGIVRAANEKGAEALERVKYYMRQIVAWTQSGSTGDGSDGGTPNISLPEMHGGGPIYQSRAYAMLEGEGVLNQKAMQNIGIEGLNALNSGATINSGGSISINNLNLPGVRTPQDFIRELNALMNSSSQLAEVMV